MTVVDASVWVSMLVPQDVHHEASRQWLETQVGEGQRLIGPVLVLIEVAAAIARRTGSREIAHKAIAKMMQIPRLHIVAIDYRLGKTATNLAANLRLRGVDAIYVAVAHRLGVPLASWDNEQVNRASRAVKILHMNQD